MGVLGGANGPFWGLPPFNSDQRGDRKRNRAKSSNSDSTGRTGHRLPLKPAATAASLTLAGDTIAQLRQRGDIIIFNNNNNESTNKDAIRNLFSDHDWLRALRMTSYGLLLYGPGSYAWYRYLDLCMPKQNIQNILLKVLLNQIVLGPTVIAVVFAWNNLWLGKLSELPNKYRKDALPTLLFGLKFWIPVSLLNFWVVPLQARVAFMSTGSIFWNFCLSSSMSK